MAHLDCRLRDSASIIDLGQLPPASPASTRKRLNALCVALYMVYE